MSLRIIIAAFSALLILATAAVGYEPDKKGTEAGTSTSTSLSNKKSPPECTKAGGVWDKTKKSCKAR